MPDSGFIGGTGTGPGTGTGTGTTPTVDPFLQSMIDEWGTMEKDEGGAWSNFYQNLYNPTPGFPYLWNAAAAHQTNENVDAAMGFMENNPIFTQEEFNAITTPGMWGDSLMKLINPQIPGFLTDIFSSYGKSGEKALGDMKGPAAADMGAYTFATSSAGQYNKEGGINMPQEATDFQTAQAGKIQQFQQTQSTIDAALKGLEDPSTATSAMLAYTQNIIGYMLTQMGNNIGGVDGSAIMAQLQANQANFTQFNEQMKQIFTGTLNLAYNLPDDIVKAITANSLTAELLKKEMEGG